MIIKTTVKSTEISEGKKYFPIYCKNTRPSERKRVKGVKDHEFFLMQAAQKQVLSPVVIVTSMN